MSIQTGDWRPYAPPQRVVKDFIVSGTAAGFVAVVELAAKRLREKFIDGWHGVKCLDPNCQNYEIVKQWPSMVDPERTHERQIVFFSVQSRGEKLSVTAEYTRLGDAPNEQAELVLSVIAAHYPEAGLDAVQVAGAETNSLVAEKELRGYQYWKDIHQQAEASGNVRLYLERKDIPKTSYYDNVKKHGLSGVSKKAGQKPDTEPDTQPLQ